MSKFLLRVIQITPLALLWLLLFFSMDEMVFDLTGFQGGQVTPSGQKSLNIEEKVMFEELFLFRPYWYKVVDVITGEKRYLLRKYIEFLKDVGLVLITLAAFLRNVLDRRIHKGALVFVPLLLISAGSAVMNQLTYPNKEISWNFFIAGVRWILPIVMAMMLVGNIDEGYMKTFSKFVVGIFFFHFWLQIVELFFSQNLYGTGMWGLANRVRGLINLPTPAGLFACLAGFFAYFHLPKSRVRSFAVVASFVSALLSGAGAAIFVWVAAAIILSFNGRFLLVKFVMLPVLAIPVFYNLGGITGRGNNIYDSIYIRFVSFMQTFENVRWFEPNFGIATNAAQILVDTYARIPDSTYISFGFNLGLLGISFLIFLFIGAIVLGLYRYSLEPIIFAVIFIIFGFGINLTESFPNNLLISLWLGYFFYVKLALNKSFNSRLICRLFYSA